MQPPPASSSFATTCASSHERHRETIQHVRLPPGPAPKKRASFTGGGASTDAPALKTRNSAAWNEKELREPARFAGRAHARRRPPDHRYNVQCAESWKQRIAKEQLHNAPVYLPGGDDDDDAASVLTVSSIRSSRTGNSVSTAMALEKIEALQKKLEEEQRRREAVEKELARLSELTKGAK